MTTSSNPVLEVSHFNVDYGVGAAAVRAVDNVTFTLERAHVLGVAGESGSGKSTLAYGLTRLLRAPGIITGGDVHLHLGTDADARRMDLLAASEAELRAIRWKHISVVMQSALNALNPVRKIGKEFDEVLKTHNRSMSKSARKDRARELLGLVNLTPDRLERYPHELSGGQRQRVMIAMALALQPELVIMDEPTTALDVVTQREIVAELQKLRQELGFALIFITHDLSLLVELADEIMVMYAGRIVERAPALELYRGPRHPYTLGLMGSFPPLHGERKVMTGIPGSPPNLKDLPGGCAFHPRCPYAMERCTLEDPMLSPIEDGQRTVACWLHDPSVSAAVPVELRRKDAALAGEAG